MTETLEQIAADTDNLTGLLVRAIDGPFAGSIMEVKASSETPPTVTLWRAGGAGIIIHTRSFDRWEAVTCALCDEPEPLGFNGWALVPFAPGGKDERFVCKRHLSEEIEHRCANCGAWQSERFSGSLYAMDPTDDERLCEECRPPEPPDRSDEY